MSKEVEKICTQVCVGCSMKDIHGLLIPTIISSGIAERKTQKKTNNGGRISNGTIEFEIATSLGLIDGFFTNHECIPSMKSAYLKFKQVYPAYEATELADEIRDKEYGHLESNNHVCMDYCGFGLYSHHQYHHDVFPSFSLSYLFANLPSHALYGAAESGTLEFQIKNRIMKFMKIKEGDDYSVIFTASRGSSFGLLAESYPFHVNKRLLTVYDYENEGLDCMVESAKVKGAKTMSALFKWPSLRICSDELKRALMTKKKRKIPKEASTDSAEGLFVFPVQSRVTGAKYSYEWMSHAQRNGWHVLLDASALGSKDMDSLGLSLVMPEFIICSFYKVYGENPTGFGCLFIKKSVIPCLHTSSAARGIGMVKIVPICKGISTASANNEIQEGLCSERPDADGGVPEAPAWGLKNKQILTTSSSGPISELHTGDQVQNSVINITESDHSNKSDTESFPGTQFGSKHGSFCFHHATSSSDIASSSSDGGAKFFRNRGSYSENERISFKHEILEEITELEEKGKENPFPNLDLMNSNGIEENDENMHLGHPRENFKNKIMDPIETSGTNREPSSQEITVTRFTGPCNIGGTGKYYHGAPLEDEPECLQSERVNSNLATVTSKSQILFRGLDHADSLGLSRSNIRLRCLINWLANALSKLCHPPSENPCHLVTIYGPKIKFNRAPSIAFNLYDWKGELVEPLLVQKLADRSGISLSYGVLHNIYFPEKYQGSIALLETKMGDGKSAALHSKHQGRTTEIRVVSAALTFVSNFEDVYRLWAFVARFLDADFVDKERLRYRGLNQKTVEL